MGDTTDPREIAALVEAVDRCIVEHCGVDDSEFIAAVMNDTHVVIANAEPIAQAILAMPEMQAIRACLRVCSDGHGWVADALPPSVLAWIEAS